MSRLCSPSLQEDDVVYGHLTQYHVMSFPSLIRPEMLVDQFRRCLSSTVYSLVSFQALSRNTDDRLAGVDVHSVVGECRRRRRV